MDILVEPVACLTIYGKQSDEEDYATEHPDSTVNFMRDWRRKEIEDWTWLQPAYAHSFMEAQAEWKRQGGDFFASDFLRTLQVQIPLKVRKPTLAAKPGTSLHGLGMAVDYDTMKLGIIGGKKMTFRELDEHMRKYGWRVHPRAFTSSSHAEAWHIQPVVFRGKNFESNMEVVRILMEEEGPKIMGMEDKIVQKISFMAGWTQLDFKEQVRRIQGMGGLGVDGVIGRQTRGFLSLLNINYVRQASTFQPD